MDTNLLFRVGQTLYGHDWEAMLSRDLAMSRRAIRRLSSGENSISVGFAHDLTLLIKGRVESIVALCKRAPADCREKLINRGMELEEICEEIVEAMGMRAAG